MKRNLDERQINEINGIAAKSFYAMFAISALSILIQLVFLNYELTFVLGETLILLSGGFIYLGYSMKKGMFSLKGKPMTLIENVMLSVICSGIFSVFLE